jgi:hypothetical protein
MKGPTYVLNCIVILFSTLLYVVAVVLSFTVYITELLSATFIYMENVHNLHFLHICEIIMK